MSRKTSLQKTWEVLFPYLLYYLTYNAAYLILTFVYQVTVGNSDGMYGAFMTAHAATVAGVMGGLCMLAGVLPLVPMLKGELRERGEAFGFAKQKAAGEREETKTADWAEKAFVKANQPDRGRKGRMSVLTAVLAFCVSLGLNALFTLIGFADSSQTYQKVADKQYGVAFAVGVILYGLISPLAEEVVFRGVIYNRLRRFYGPVIGVVVSGIFFGAFHGNLVQGVYGTCMGILIAYVYERQGNFFFPVLFHAAANLTVYSIAHEQAVQEALFTPLGCGILLAVSAGCVFFMERGRR